MVYNWVIFVVWCVWVDGSISVLPNTSMTAFSKNKSAKLFGTMLGPYQDGTSAPSVPVVWYIWYPVLPMVGTLGALIIFTE